MIEGRQESGLAHNTESGGQVQDGGIMGQETGPDCKIKRGNCLTRNIPAEKRITSTKRWGKQKHRFGWIYGKKVTWIWRMKSKVSEASNISSIDPVNQMDETPAINMSESGTLNNISGD